ARCNAHRRAIQPAERLALDPARQPPLQSAPPVPAEYELCRPLIPFYLTYGRPAESASRSRVPSRSRNESQHALFPEPSLRRQRPHGHPRGHGRREELFVELPLDEPPEIPAA